MESYLLKGKWVCVLLVAYLAVVQARTRLSTQDTTSHGAKTLEHTQSLARVQLQGGCGSCPYTNGVCCPQATSCCPAATQCHASQPTCQPAVTSTDQSNVNVYVGGDTSTQELANVLKALLAQPAPQPDLGPTIRMVMEQKAQEEEQKSYEREERKIRRREKKKERKQEKATPAPTPTPTTPTPQPPDFQQKKREYTDGINHELDQASRSAHIAQKHLRHATDVALRRVQRAQRITHMLERGGKQMDDAINHDLGLKKGHNKDAAAATNGTAPDPNLVAAIVEQLKQSGLIAAAGGAGGAAGGGPKVPGKWPGADANNTNGTTPTTKPPGTSAAQQVADLKKQRATAEQKLAQQKRANQQLLLKTFGKDILSATNTLPTDLQEFRKEAFWPEQETTTTPAPTGTPAAAANGGDAPKQQPVPSDVTSPSARF